MATNHASRSLRSILILAAVAAVSALSTAYHRAVDRVAAAGEFCWRWLTASAQHVVAALANHPSYTQPVGITLHQVRQFMNRQAKRDRVTVTAGWRAVPSI